MQTTRIIKIAVCGSATGMFVPELLTKSFQIGQAIAKKDAILITGATSGYPYEAAKGATAAGGLSIGISPANDYNEHIEVIKKPVDAYDPIIFTGYGFRGRNVIIVQSADAVVFVAGGTGTLNEFCIAYDTRKPIGLLSGSGGLELMVETIVKNNYKPPPPIIREANPHTLVEKLVSLVQS